MRLKVAQRPKSSLARLTPQTHSVCLLHRTAASFTLSVTGLVNGRRLAAARAAFAVVVGPAAASTVGAAAWQARHRCCVGAGCVSCCLCAPPCLELLITPLCVKREQYLRKKSTFLGPHRLKNRRCAARAKKALFHRAIFDLRSEADFFENRAARTSFHVIMKQDRVPTNAHRHLIMRKRGTKFTGFLRKEACTR